MNKEKNIVPEGVDPYDEKTWICPRHWHNDIKEDHGWEFDTLGAASEYLKDKISFLNTKLFIDDEDPGLMFIHVFWRNCKLGEVYVNKATTNPQDIGSECYSKNQDDVCYSVFIENDENSEVHTLYLNEVSTLFLKSIIN